MTRALLALGLIFVALPVGAQELSMPALTMTTQEDGSQSWSLSFQVLVAMTLITLMPALLLSMTGFVRIIVVLSLLRTAIGLQQSPPNAVMISLALFLTAFIMAPVFTQSYNEGTEPLLNGQIETEEAFERSAEPVNMFMLAHTREDDLALFFGIADVEPESPEATPVYVVAPAFMISELRRAFEIGFLLFIPFLIIDLVVASILMSMGMMMLPPVIISLPFKLIFFVLVDGWHLVAGSLIRSFTG